jgi:HAD superfamily hydrolase (TIGR02253 family)
MIKVVSFDVDNTLLDFFELKRIVCTQAVEAMIDAGLDMSEKKIMKELYELYDKHGYEDHKIFNKLLRKLEGKIDYKKLSYGIVAYRKARVGMLDTYPGVKRTLIKLKEMGMRLIIISDAPALQAWLRLAAVKIDDFFEFVIISGKNNKGTGKPFERALRKLKVKPEEVLHVGDWPERDVKGAEKIGVHSCFAKYGNTHLKGVKADYTIKDIKELVDVVKKANKV